jgi:hypothetical protein
MSRQQRRKGRNAEMLKMHHFMAGTAPTGQ